MADISKIKVQGTTYDVKDVKARSFAMHSVLPLVDIVEEQEGDVFEMTTLATGLARDVYYVIREDTDAAPSGFYLKSASADGTYYKMWKEGAVPSWERYGGAANSNLYIKDGALYRLQGDSLTPVMGGGGGGELGEDVVISKGADAAYNFGNGASIGAGAVMGKDAKVGAGVGLSGSNGGLIASAGGKEMVALGGKDQVSGKEVKVAIGTIIPGGVAVSDEDVVIGAGVKIGQGAQIGESVEISNGFTAILDLNSNVSIGSIGDYIQLNKGSKLGTNIHVLRDDNSSSNDIDLCLGTGMLRVGNVESYNYALVIKNESKYDAAIRFFDRRVMFGSDTKGEHDGFSLSFGTEMTVKHCLTVGETYLAVGTGAVETQMLQDFKGMSISKANEIANKGAHISMGTGHMDYYCDGEGFKIEVSSTRVRIESKGSGRYVDIPLINGTLGAEVANEVMEVD